MFEWTNPKKVENITQYYLYLLFSYNGRIGPGDFARGFFFGYFTLLLTSFLLPMFLLQLDLIGFFLVTAGIMLFLNVLALTFLPLKRLKDMGWGEDGRALVITFSYLGIMFFGLGPILLFIGCFFAPGQEVGNSNGKVCTIYEDIKKRRESLINKGNTLLKHKDFEGAINAYELLGDKKLVSRTKKRHVSYQFDILHTQITRMVEKEVLCEDLINITNNLKNPVNNYLGFTSSEAGK